jgi:hypothetical protein
MTGQLDFGAQWHDNPAGMSCLPHSLICLLFTTSFAFAESFGSGSRLRDWTSTDGKAVSGRMMESDGTSVTLRVKATGKEVKVPLARLSEQDRAFVTETGWPTPRPWNKWPSDIKLGLGDVDVRLVSSAANRYLYQTRHFELVSEAELGQTPAKDIARMFEATYSLLQASPWGILAKPKGDRFRAELYSSRDSYIKAGGPPDSAGVYLLEKKIFMVPFETLGLVQASSGWERTEEYSTRTLIHELTHMMMDDALIGMPMWLAEGAAEYMELMPMKIGTFSPASHLAAVKEQHAQQHASPLLQVLTMSHGEWESGGAAKPARAPQSSPGGHVPMVTTGQNAFGRQQTMLSHYEAGLLLTYYFIHLDGNGDAERLQRFIAACAKNSKRLDHYFVLCEQYEKAFEEFKKHPDVFHVGGDTYRFPPTLKPPVPPPWPFDGEPGDIHTADLELLLDGRSPHGLIVDVQEALAKAQITTASGAADTPKRRDR